MNPGKWNKIPKFYHELNASTGVIPITKPLNHHVGVTTRRFGRHDLPGWMEHPMREILGSNE